MLYYELKKAWVKPGTKIALLVLALFMTFMCVSAIKEVYFINENGDHEYGPGAARKLRAAQKEWAGTLTEEVISKVIEENARIISTEEYNSSDIRQKNIAYGWTLGFNDIRWMLVYSCAAFRSSDYFAPDRLKPEDAAYFYSNRVRHLREWLDSDEATSVYSEDEKEFLIEQYEALETPFQYDYFRGWESLLSYIGGVVMFVALTMGFVVTGIFAGEFAYRADSVFYVSYHGRKKAVMVKLEAAVILTTLVYWITVLLYSAVVLGVLGADGAGLPIQVSGAMSKWKVFYRFTYGQLYLLTVLGGYVGVMFTMLLTMFTAAKTKTTALPVTVPFLLIFLPTFIQNINLPGNLAGKILGLLPDQILQISQIISYFNLYHIGGKVVGALGILFVIYTVLSVILYPMVYQIYRKIEIK